MAIRNQEVTNSLIEEAEHYLARHQVLELFEDLCTLLAFEKPADIKSFLISELKNRKVRGPAGNVIFTEQELKNVFTLFDLRQEGLLNREQCREALRTIAHSAHQHETVDKLEVPEKVDVMNFRKLVMHVLG